MNEAMNSEISPSLQGTLWSREDDEKLKALVAADYDYAQLLDAFRGRTRSSLTGRMWKLGLRLTQKAAYRSRTTGHAKPPKPKRGKSPWRKPWVAPPLDSDVDLAATFLRRKGDMPVYRASVDDPRATATFVVNRMRLSPAELMARAVAKGWSGATA